MTNTRFIGETRCRKNPTTQSKYVVMDWEDSDHEDKHAYIKKIVNLDDCFKRDDDFADTKLYACFIKVSLG